MKFKNVVNGISGLGLLASASSLLSGRLDLAGAFLAATAVFWSTSPSEGQVFPENNAVFEEPVDPSKRRKDVFRLVNF